MNTDAFSHIQPDHYFERHIPVFRPTVEQFKDFYRYVNAIDHFGMQSGIVKIIPPDEWKAQLPKISPDKIAEVKIQAAIRQVVHGKTGVFMQQNMPCRRKLTVQQWKALCNEDEYRMPSLQDENLIQQAKRAKVDAPKNEPPKKEQIEENSDDPESFLPDEPFHASPEELRVLEKLYWRSLTSEAPIYGADMFVFLYLELTHFFLL
jgi:hypothetical protein